MNHCKLIGHSAQSHHADVESSQMHGWTARVIFCIGLLSLKGIEASAQEDINVIRPGVFDKSPASESISRRSPYLAADFEQLWKASHRLHPGGTTKYDVGVAFSTYEFLLQTAADELDTGEPLKASWARELISLYTRPTHKWPAVSKTLDRALQWRARLIQLTDQKTVDILERTLHRFPAAPPRSPSSQWTSEHKKHYVQPN